MTRYLGDDFLQPVLDANNTPWFTSGELQVQFCDDCDAARFPPEDVCFKCQSVNLGFRGLPGTGKIESVVEVQHPVHPLLADKVPYNVAVISLDGAEGCNAIGNILGDAVKPEIGQAVKVVFEAATGPDGEELKIPNWEIA